MLCPKLTLTTAPSGSPCFSALFPPRRRARDAIFQAEWFTPAFPMTSSLIEAFRRRAIYPREVLSLATDNLVWDKVQNTPEQEDALKLIQPDAKPLLERLNAWDLSADRKRVFEYARDMRRFLHQRLAGIR